MQSNHSAFSLNFQFVQYWKTDGGIQAQVLSYSIPDLSERQKGFCDDDVSDEDDDNDDDDDNGDDDDDDASKKLLPWLCL